jgi:hypothetical protein
VAVFTRRAQDITVSCTNPEGGRLYAWRMRFVQDAVMLKHRHITTGAADHTLPRTVAGAMNCSVTPALAEGEPQAAGEVSFARCAVVKRRRQRSGHTLLRSGSQGRFLAAGALSDTTELARRGACAFGLLQAA